MPKAEAVVILTWIWPETEKPLGKGLMVRELKTMGPSWEVGAMEKEGTPMRKAEAEWGKRKRERTAKR